MVHIPYWDHDRIWHMLPSLWFIQVVDGNQQVQTQGSTQNWLNLQPHCCFALHLGTKPIYPCSCLASGLCKNGAKQKAMTAATWHVMIVLMAYALNAGQHTKSAPLGRVEGGKTPHGVSSTQKCGHHVERLQESVSACFDRAACHAIIQSAVCYCVG